MHEVFWSVGRIFGLGFGGAGDFLILRKTTLGGFFCGRAVLGGVSIG